MATTTVSNQTARLRVIPKFGDLAMIVGLVRSNIWQQIYNGEKKYWWTIFIWLLNIKIELFASCGRLLLRYNHGRHTTGVLTFIWTISMMVAFNHIHAFGYFITFIPFIAPVLFVWLDINDVERIVFVDVHSELLVYWMVIYTLVSLIHIIIIYGEWGEIKDHTKRGTSIIYKVISRFRPIKEAKIEIAIEPLFLLLIGYCGSQFEEGPVFFIFMSIVAGCLFIQDVSDEAWRCLHTKS